MPGCVCPASRVSAPSLTICSVADSESPGVHPHPDRGGPKDFLDMALTGLDIIVLIVIGGAAVLGFIRGFTTEILALAVWLVLVLAIKLLHTPLAAILAGIVGTAQGAAVLSFAIIAGVTYFGGRIVANMVGSRTRQSFLGPIDRALG